jgi:hypothetical protein
MNWAQMLKATVSIEKQDLSECTKKIFRIFTKNHALLKMRPELDGQDVEAFSREDTSSLSI